MAAQAAPLVYSKELSNNLLTGAINPALAAPLLPAAAKMFLGTGVVTITPSTTFASLVEATFTGYSESATIVWETTPLNEADGTLTAVCPSHLFQCTGSGTPNQITIAGGTDGVASPDTNWLMAGSLPTPVNIINPGDGIQVYLEFNMLLATSNANAVIGT